MLSEIPVKELKLRKDRVELLKQLKIETIEDLLQYYPYRYEAIEVVPFKEFVNDEKVTFEAEIITDTVVRYLPKKKTLMTFKVRLTESEEVLSILIYNRHFLQPQLYLNRKVIIIGKYNVKKAMVMAGDIKLKTLADIEGVTPVYSIKEGIAQKSIVNYINKALEIYGGLVMGDVPEEISRRYRLGDKLTALKKIHQPKTLDDVHQAHRYLKYEEFLRFQVLMQAMKADAKATILGQKKSFSREEISEKVANLPYSLTVDQTASLTEILADLDSETVMYRLLQGEVGSGKTVISMLSVYANYLAGFQSAVMAPTELLARQHYKNFVNFFADTNVKVELLIGGLKPQEKEYVQAKVVKGDVDVLIGTHSLIQDNVEFKNLGLVVTDELQRFGVGQRRLLKEKGYRVDYLSMTATPIPRTLALSLFGDMDVSTIEQLPIGRREIITKYVNHGNYLNILDEVGDLLRLKTTQCYIVCPIIDEGVRSEFNLTDVYQKVKDHLGATCEVGILHGRMNDVQKEEIMQAFIQRKIDVLISTTVIEVGIDVPTANIMIILDAHVFGLSQLHQLRGRVGRSDQQGYCFLVSPSKDGQAVERLTKMEQAKNGFEVSKLDLEIRGPGDMLGFKQSGLPPFNVADIVKDEIILQVAREDALKILEQWGSPQYRDLTRKIERIMEEQNNVVYID